MLTKAIIEGPGKEKNKFLVRIPILDGFENTPEGVSKELLSEATLCTLPGITTPLVKGDIVFVDFETNNLAKPVILGNLYLGNSQYINNFPDEKNTHSIGLNLNNLIMGNLSSAKLPESTYIGNISYKDLRNFKMLYDNFYDRFFTLFNLSGNNPESSDDIKDSDSEEEEIK